MSSATKRGADTQRDDRGLASAKKRATTPLSSVSPPSSAKTRDDWYCPVCLEARAVALAENGGIVALVCAHTFCRSCVDDWLQSHNTCPVCKTVQTSALPDTAASSGHRQNNASGASSISNSGPRAGAYRPRHNLLARFFALSGGSASSLRAPFRSPMVINVDSDDDQDDDDDDNGADESDANDNVDPAVLGAAIHNAVREWGMLAPARRVDVPRVSLLNLQQREQADIAAAIRNSLADMAAQPRPERAEQNDDRTPDRIFSDEMRRAGQRSLAQQQQQQQQRRANHRRVDVQQLEQRNAQRQHNNVADQRQNRQNRDSALEAMLPPVARAPRRRRIGADSGAGCGAPMRLPPARRVARRGASVASAPALGVSVAVDESVDLSRAQEGGIGVSIDSSVQQWSADKIKCPVQGCTSTVLRRNWNRHVARCHAIEQCAVCQQTVPHHLMRRHVQTCNAPRNM